MLRVKILKETSTIKLEKEVNRILKKIDKLEELNFHKIDNFYYMIVSYKAHD